MSIYLCYDLKGIQQYIFQIPKLKCCIGGSRQVDSFDRNDAGKIQIPGVQMIYTGGGKGAFRCDDAASLETLKVKLISFAREKGLTIRFGIDPDYSAAARYIKETYCYQPDTLEGHPCELSGLYPVDDARKIHPLIQQRERLGAQHGQESETESYFLTAIRKKFKRNYNFFYNVDASSDAEGEEGAFALGNRNRWAVVCMDGNDMGLQFLAFKNQNPGDAQWQKWLQGMSQSLDQCTCEAALQGMLCVTEKYEEDLKAATEYSDTLPIRPLIVGGDDITVLISCKYAHLFVESVIKAFQTESRKYKQYWVGTGGELSISAGCLFAPVSLPLHSSIAYAETLLASAKTHGRDLKKGLAESALSPACFDWESVTEGLLDSPAARRNREFRFTDGESGNIVELTSRAYSMEEMKELDEIRSKLQKIPKNILYQIHPALLQPKEKRMAFYARIGKNHPVLKQGLMEPLKGEKYGSFWMVSGKVQKTRLLDALLLMQEEDRMTRETVC